MATLADEIADKVVGRIAEGLYEPGDALPSESELASTLGVSRLTLREAFNTLRSLGVLDVRRGRGTFVAPVSQWTGVAPVTALLENRGGELNTSVQILELRRMLEVGAARLAASRISDAELADLDRHVTQMRRSHHRSDVTAFVVADLAFHAVVLQASGNVLAPVVLNQLASILNATRRETSSVNEIRQHAIAMHTQILEALRAKEPATAAEAMDAHMSQTLDDLHRYVLRHESDEL